MKYTEVIKLAYSKTELSHVSLDTYHTIAMLYMAHIKQVVNLSQIPSVKIEGIGRFKANPKSVKVALHRLSEHHPERVDRIKELIKVYNQNVKLKSNLNEADFIRQIEEPPGVIES